MGEGLSGGVVQSAVGYWRTFITRKIACRTILSLLMLHLACLLSSAFITQEKYHLFKQLIFC